MLGPWFRSVQVLNQTKSAGAVSLKGFSAKPLTRLLPTDLLSLFDFCGVLPAYALDANSVLVSVQHK